MANYGNVNEKPTLEREQNRWLKQNRISYPKYLNVHLHDKKKFKIKEKYVLFEIYFEILFCK